jgi:CheY-like chemotaxis protein
MSSASGPNTLVVDDDPIVIHLLKTYFQSIGWSGLFAQTTDEALEHLRSGAVDRALVDIHLNRESGLELIRMIRTQWPGIRVVAMTGAIDAEPRTGSSAGAMTLIPKPFPSLSAVREAFERTGTA